MEQNRDNEIESTTRNDLDFLTFQKQFEVGKDDFCKEVYRVRKGSIQIKKEKTVIKNLAKIFDATFRLCTRKGFQGMSMRDLSQESGLSMGALYSYFKSKEELLNTLQHVGNSFIQKFLEQAALAEDDAYTRLRFTIKTHIFLSEIVQPWFYFSYMEAKSLCRKERDFYKQAELYTEKLILHILEDGEKQGVFQQRDHGMAASVIKAMLQDWYLKRWKYAKRDVTVDHYADFVMSFIESFYLDLESADTDE